MKSVNYEFVIFYSTGPIYSKDYSKIGMDKRSSLFGSIVYGDEKRIIRLTSTAQCYKTFYGCNLQMFLIR